MSGDTAPSRQSYVGRGDVANDDGDEDMMMSFSSSSSLMHAYLASDRYAHHVAVEDAGWTGGCSPQVEQNRRFLEARKLYSENRGWYMLYHVPAP